MKVAFLTREPMVHQFGGSTTAALNLLALLVAQGCEIDVFVSSAFSRSPKLFWKRKIALPQGVRFSAPGFWRFNDWCANPFNWRAWGRAFLRLAARGRGLGWLRCLAGRNVVGDAWDLTPVEERERAAAVRFVAKVDADVVIANYAFWAPVLRDPALAKRRRAVLMHDLLSARVARFQAAGLPLDCIPVTREQEIGWLNAADIVLAIQAAEADEIRPLVSAEVLVQPFSMAIRSASTTAEANRCLFVGTRIEPNRTGIQWFLDAIWPLILSANPAATLAIAGTVCEVVEVRSPGVVLGGVADSLDAELDRAGICILPLLIGSGLKIKLLEALACGKACVSTPVGVQGLEEETAGVVEVCIEPKEFASAVLRLMRDADLHKAREMAAHTLAQRMFGPQSEAQRGFADKLMGR